MAPCSKCNGGKFRFGNSEYLCDGYINQWVECDNVVKEPERRAIEIPLKIGNKYPFLAFPFEAQNRTVREPVFLFKSFPAHPQTDLWQYLKKMDPKGEFI